MPTVAAIPEDMMEKAKLKKLEYTSVLEMLAERFHASPALLKRLNPSAKFAEGEQITVPNVNVVSEAEGKADSGYRGAGVEAGVGVDGYRRLRQGDHARAGHQRQPA